MGDETQPEDGYGKLGRPCFPEDERIHPWLVMLLDAYAVADRGVAEGIRREERQGRRLACCKGCSSCCRTHKTIPVYPLELVGISWYATEKIQGPVRERLKVRLRAHTEGDACPFLVDDICCVHPVRPLACRHFNVFGEVCAEGEDAYYTRRNDVLSPIKRYMDDAFHAMLPFHGIKKKAERRKVVKTGAMHRMARVMQELDWDTLADKMDAFDRRRRD